MRQLGCGLKVRNIPPGQLDQASISRKISIVLNSTTKNLLTKSLGVGNRPHSPPRQAKHLASSTSARGRSSVSGTPGIGTATEVASAKKRSAIEDNMNFEGLKCGSRVQIMERSEYTDGGVGSDGDQL